MRTGFIDWTAAGITLFEYEKKGTQYKLANKTSITLEGEPDPNILAPLLRPGIRDIHLSIPIDILTLREQDFPFEDEEKIRDTIAFELEGVLLGSTEDYSIGHKVTGKLNTGTNVLAVCIEKKRLQEIIETFSSAGLDPKVITSLDISMHSGEAESLFDNIISDPDARAEAAASELTSPSINLRQEEMAYTGDIERLNNRLRFTAMLTLVLVIILGINMSIGLIAAKRENGALKAETERAYRALFPEERKIIDIERQLNGNIKRLELKNAALTGIPLLDLLRSIADLKDTTITLNEFSADGKNIMIKGTAGTFEDVDILKSSLSREFNGAKVIDSGAGADKKIGFTIIMQEKRA